MFKERNSPFDNDHPEDPVEGAADNAGALCRAVDVDLGAQAGALEGEVDGERALVVDAPVDRGDVGGAVRQLRDSALGGPIAGHMGHLKRRQSRGNRV